ncbi:HDIG domain-containing protein [Parabacteroides sp. OttesenSCG-928-N08]|nr:HDIG domain-containing protein [Parabacteroides sp. OttesenSCG-928-N08]
MKIRLSKIPGAIYFILVAIIIIWLFPREAKFRYQFFEGKPWRYGLLTTSRSFPIYKTDEEVKQERDSLLRNTYPYYRLEQQVESNEIERLRASYTPALKQKVSPAYMQYIEHSLSELYKKGIISPQDMEELNREQHEQVYVFLNNVWQTHYSADFFTERTAYEFIVNNIPRGLDKAVLQLCNIDHFLSVNMAYDAAMTEKVKQDKINSVSLSKGMVQAGERIVDRGEVVDQHTYNVLRSMKIIYESQSGGKQRQGILLGGISVLIAGVILCFWLYLRSFRKIIFNNKRSIIFLLLCILTACVITELFVLFNLPGIYLIPYATIPIVVRVFFDSRTAFSTHLSIILICSLMAPFPHEFIFLQLIVGMVVNFSLKDLSERSHLIRCAFFIFMAYVIGYTCISLYQEADFQKINWVNILYFGINFILLMFSYILVYMLEKAFGYVSSITLVELSNINTPLLKKLSETAPGTFQHSLQVSILAADAASKIGADTQLVRTGALYHDIGKMQNPAFFTENQASVNPHDQLTLEQSAQVIISHVTDGLKIAEKANIPKAITNFIRTHHGCGITKYFYNTYKNKYPDKEVDITKFQYPGPNPFTKETAILMMADSVEAASRSLKEHTEEGIHSLVTKIIDGQMADGLMRSAPLTFRDVEAIKQVFIDKLKTMYHTRISYPDVKKPADK